MPSKSKTVMRTDSAVCNYQNKSGSVWLPAQKVTDSRLSQSYKMSKTWTNTPNFANLIRSGGILPDRSFAYDEAIMEEHPISTSFSAPTFRGTQTQTHWLGVNPPSAIIDTSSMSFSRARSGAVSKVVDSVKGNEFNVPIFLAEADKTAMMVYQSARSLVYLLRALRRGNIGYFLDNLHITTPPIDKRKAIRKFNSDFGRDASKAASNTWLEYTYGWSPFMGDVRNAVNATMDACESQPSLVQTSSKQCSQRETTKKSFTNSTENYCGLNISNTYEYVDEIKNTVRVTWRYKVNPADLPGRFGLTNPLEVAWELVPYSFVADWFLPVGDYLRTLDLAHRFTSNGGVYGYRQEINRTYNYIKSDSWVSRKLSKAKNVSVSIRREPFTGPPTIGIPTLFKSVSFGLNVKRAISSISLLRQNFK